MEKKIDSQKADEGYAIFPEKELKCIWMTAGMIAYKLCKYNLQCDRCPLYWELRNVSADLLTDLNSSVGGDLKIPEQVEGIPYIEEKGEEELFNLKEDLFYHPGHTWIKVEKAEEVRIGIDYFLANLLMDIRVVILPLPGRRWIQGEDLCSIIQEGGFPISFLPLVELSSPLIKG